jgi:hypothetical protein
MNRSWNSASGAFSCWRKNPISKYPLEFVAQRDASTDTTAVHLRSKVGGCIAENWTSLKANTGLQVCPPAACVALTSPIMPARRPGMHDLDICEFSGLLRKISSRTVPMGASRPWRCSESRFRAWHAGG